MPPRTRPPIEFEQETLRGAQIPYQDRYAGFRLDPPSGWVQVSSYLGVVSWSPREEAMFSYPDYMTASGHDLYTIQIRTDQTQSFEEWIAWRRDHVGFRNRAEEERLMVAGRSAFSILEHRENTVPPCDCIDESIALPWDDHTLIEFGVIAGSRAVYERHSGALRTLLESIRPGAVEPSAATIRAFMEARVAGNDAARWLTPEGDAEFRRSHLNLYSFDTAGAGTALDIEAFSVAAPYVMKGGRASYLVDVGRGQFERFLVGIDKNRGERTHLVLDAELVRWAGVS